jgi:hypothetical protein
MRGIEAQFLALQKGFNEIIPQHLLKPFDERELEVILHCFFFTLVYDTIFNLWVLQYLLLKLYVFRSPE